MSKLASTELSSLRVRDPCRSAGSTAELPRTSVEVFLPQGLSPVGTEILIRQMRRLVLTPEMLIGNKELYVADDALVLECLSPAVMTKASPLCSEALFLSPDKVLIRTEASADTWVQVMDQLCREGELTIISKLRWKASRFGGRPFALPTATSSALAASRRRKGKAGRGPQLTDFATEVRINGEPGLQDKMLFDALINHVCQSTGLRLAPYDPSTSWSSGFWKHLASHDPAAPPGRARLFLGSKEEVTKVHEALHGQVVQVGEDWLSVTVHNDLLDVGSWMGNGGRAP